MFEELQPAAIVAKRGGGVPLVEGEAAPAVEYLVHWGDGSPDTWEPERNVADDVIADFEAGLEYASAVAISAQRRAGGCTEYLVTWADGAEQSWQEEEQIDEGVMRAWLDVRVDGAGKQQRGRRKEAKPRNAKQQTELSEFHPLQQADTQVHT
jgi:signal recognition particle protein